MLGLVYVLPFVAIAGLGSAVAAEGATIVASESPVNGTKYWEASSATSAFREFQRILRGYSDVYFESEVLRILKGKEVSREQFENDVAAYVLKENEWGYVEREDEDYARAMQEIKLLRRAMERVSAKAQALHDALLSYAGKSIQTALNNEAVKRDESGKLTSEEAEKAYREFSLSMVRLFARDLVAFRSHAQWLDGDVQSESPNRAPRSISVSQYLSCNGNNAEIIMSADDALHLWSRQVAMVENDLFALSEGDETYTDPISRTVWGDSSTATKKTVATLKNEWDGVKTTYAAYMKAWADAFAPMPGYRGSGTPYWCTDMCMHMLSHWEELVSYMRFRNNSRLNEENMDCFLLSLPGKEVDDFANIYIKKLSIALKLAEGEEESEILDVETEAEYLREHVARLYDARMRCAIAGISCEFYGDKKRISEATEKARKHIRESLLQDIKEICRMGTAKADSQQQGVYNSVSGMELWRKQMRLLLTEIGKSYEYPGNPEPFSGKRNPAAPEFTDTHVKRIQDLLEETDVAWNWYRRSWILLSCNLSAVDIYSEYPLHVHREQWLKELYRRVCTQKSTEDEMDTEN